MKTKNYQSERKAFVLENEPALKAKIIEETGRKYHGIGLKAFDYSGGSNPFLITAVNRTLLDHGYRIARLNEAGGFISNFSFDLGLVLRNGNAEETFLGKNLLSQIKQIAPDVYLPIKIDLADLVLEENPENTLLGCSFKLMDNPIIASSLSILEHRNGNFLDNDVNPETGLPKRYTVHGKRRMFTTSNSQSQPDITRFILTQDRSINANYPDLTRMLHSGGILVIKNV
jgi:hypothetical protein